MDSSPCLPLPFLLGIVASALRGSRSDGARCSERLGASATTQRRCRPYVLDVRIVHSRRGLRLVLQQHQRPLCAASPDECSNVNEFTWTWTRPAAGRRRQRQSGRCGEDPGDDRRGHRSSRRAPPSRRVPWPRPGHGPPKPAATRACPLQIQPFQEVGPMPSLGARAVRMGARLQLSDSKWAKIQAFLAGDYRVGEPGRDDRNFIEAVLWWRRTGVPWRDLPDEFGPWKTVFNRFNRWSKNGKWDRLYRALQTDIDDEWHSLDSTSNRAHQHAAGGKGGRRSTQSGAPGGLRPRSIWSSTRSACR